MAEDARLATENFLEDAAHYPGGHAEGVVFPQSAADVVDVLARAESVLPIGAQSSLTGGATPRGELILATSRMNRVTGLTADDITVEAGITVAAMQDHLAAVGAWFPPAPTFAGACAGGIVATNAAGAATFKYGSTRNWVKGIEVVLADGTILDVRRGEHTARNGRLDVETRRGRLSVPVPSYVMPAVAKRSAGYHASPGMDLVDLFIGSEGTLGVVTRVTFRILSPAPPTALALVACTSEAQSLDLVRALRDASQLTWQTKDPAGIDAAAIENMDRRAIAILKEDGADERNNVRLPSDTAVVLLVRLELPEGTTAAEAYDQVAAALTASAPETPLVSFCRLAHSFGLLDRVELSAPGDRRRAEQLIAIREAVPSGVNHRVALAKHRVDDRIAKSGGDMIVPFERFGEMMQIYRRGFESRGLDYGIWGHVSDGNVHPNVIPRTYADVERGNEAFLEFGREVARLGGCPLAEHGVGRSPVKQALLRQLYGDRGIEEMRAVKRALDPDWKLAPGVIFSR
jgi:D-lactate dehydrogenase (cytochrome)